MDYYCISVIGDEEKFSERVQRKILGIRTIVFKKKMRLKKGKQYEERLFPGYVFLETDREIDVCAFRKIIGFCRFLPETKDAHRILGNDLEIIKKLLFYGTVMDEVPVMFDENDKVVILSGPFKGLDGHVVAVNKRNHRLNVQLDFMNGMKLLGLTYKEVSLAVEQSADGS